MKILFRLVVWLLASVGFVASADTYYINFGPIVNSSSCSFGFWVEVDVNGVFNRWEQQLTIAPHSTQPVYNAVYPNSALNNVTYKFIRPFTATNGPFSASASLGGAAGLQYPGSVDGCAGTMCIATNISYQFTIKNNSTENEMWWVTAGGSPVCGSFSWTSGATCMGCGILPGQTFVLNTPPLPVGCGSPDPGYTIQQYNAQTASSCAGSGGAPDGPAISGTAAGPTGTSTGGGSGGSVTAPGGTGATGGGPGAGTTGTTYQPTNVNSITFSNAVSPGGTNAVTDATAQEGFGAIYDAVNRQGASIVVAVGAVQQQLQKEEPIWQAGTNFQGASMALLAAGFGTETNILIQETNLSTRALFQLSNSVVFQTNALSQLSNAVVSGTVNITNVLGWQVASNVVNTLVLSNLMRGVSNAVVSSGTNEGSFLSNSFYSVMNGLTNFGGGGSNIFSDNGITNSIDSEHFDITNAWGQASATNEFGNYASVGGMLAGTNQAAALAAGTAASSDAAGVSDSAISGIGSPPTVGDGSMPSMVLGTLGGVTIDVSPEHIAPGVSASLKAMLAMVALLGFALAASKLYWQACQTYAAAQTGGVPDLNGEVLGFGGNVLGAIAAVAVPVIFIALWVVVFTGLFSLVTSELSGLASSSLSLGNAMALEILRAVFPVDLILSLAWTLIALHFSASKLVIISSSASRYLFGR